MAAAQELLLSQLTAEGPAAFSIVTQPLVYIVYIVYYILYILPQQKVQHPSVL